MNACYSFVTEYCGEIDEQTLSRAFEILIERHAVLRSRIRKDGDEYLLYATGDHRPEFVTLIGDEDTLMSEVNCSWDVARSVSRLVLIRNREYGFVSLQADHSIVDARSLGAMLQELWRLYTNISNKMSTPRRFGKDLPVSGYSLYTERWQDPINSRPTARSATSRPLTAIFASGTICRRIQLTNEDSRKLLAEAHSHGLSLHTLICGKILAAHRSQIPQLDSLSMTCVSVVDLRSRVDPPVGATETTNFLGLHAANLMLPNSADSIVVGKQIKSELATAIDSRNLYLEFSEIFVEGAPKSNEMGPHTDPYATIFVSNVGIVPRFETPADLNVIDWVVPVRHETASPIPTYAVYTYSDCLSVRCVYPSILFTDFDVDQLIDKITNLMPSGAQTRRTCRSSMRFVSAK